MSTADPSLLILIALRARIRRAGGMLDLRHRTTAHELGCSIPDMRAAVALGLSTNRLVRTSQRGRTVLSLPRKSGGVPSLAAALKGVFVPKGTKQHHPGPDIDIRGDTGAELELPDPED